MIGRLVDIPQRPQRIVSLVPSITELLFDFDLNPRVVGVTKFCSEPKSWRIKKQVVGGTKEVKWDAITACEPDLIIANKEENTKEDIDALSERYPVFVTDVSNLSESLDMINQIGVICDKTEQAKGFSVATANAFANLDNIAEDGRIAYMIWRNPYMSVGSDTFIHDMITRMGFTNVFADRSRYPETTLEELDNLAPDVIYLSSEPFPFKEKHGAEIAEALPYTEIRYVDGTFFSWYGTRLMHAPAYFRQLIAQQ